MMMIVKASPEEAFFCQPKQSEDTFQWQNTEPRRQGSPLKALPWEQKGPETAENQNTNESAPWDEYDGDIV